MRLNAYVVEFDLGQLVEGANIASKPTSFDITAPLVFNPDDQILFGEVCYVANASQLTRAVYNSLSLTMPHGKMFTVVSVGRPPDVFIQSPRCNVLWTRPDRSLIDVLTRVQEVFARFAQWENALTDILRRSGTIQEMIHVSLPVVQNDIRLIDYNYFVLASEVYEYRRLDAGMLSSLRVGDYLPREMRDEATNKEAHRSNVFDSEVPTYFRTVAHGGTLTIHQTIRGSD